MTLKDHDKREALAQKYGWHIMGWALELDNPAGICLKSNDDQHRFLRFRHSDSLKKWESVLKATENKAKVGRIAMTEPQLPEYGPLLNGSTFLGMSRFTDSGEGPQWGGYGRYVRAEDHHDQNAASAAEIQRLRSALDESRADAERYRLLRLGEDELGTEHEEKILANLWYALFHNKECCREPMDKAVDRAMAAIKAALSETQGLPGGKT